MCDSYEERLYWARRIEQMRREKEKADELRKQQKPSTPARPAAPAPDVRKDEPVPA